MEGIYIYLNLELGNFFDKQLINRGNLINPKHRYINVLNAHILSVNIAFYLTI